MERQRNPGLERIDFESPVRATQTVLDSSKMQFCFAPPGMRVKLRGSVASAEGAAERTAVPGSAGVPPAQFNTCTDGLSRTVRDGSGDPSSHAKAKEPARRRRSQEKRIFSALQMVHLSSGA